MHRYNLIKVSRQKMVSHRLSEEGFTYSIQIQSYLDSIQKIVSHRLSCIQFHINLIRL